MNIAIIGEAMNRLLKLQPDLAISHARKIANTRNYVIHGYDSLRNEILWAIVINDLPILLQEVEQLLSQQNPKTIEADIMLLSLNSCKQLNLLLKTTGIIATNGCFFGDRILGKA